jgi:hypothetical protein
MTLDHCPGWGDGPRKMAVAAAAPRTRRYRLSDSLVPGLGLLVLPSGWYLWHWVDGRQRKLRLGTPAEITPDQARALAREALARVRAGGDPVEGRRYLAPDELARLREALARWEGAGPLAVRSLRPAGAPAGAHRGPAEGGDVRGVELGRLGSGGAASAGRTGEDGGGGGAAERAGAGDPAGAGGGGRGAAGGRPGVVPGATGERPPSHRISW